MDLYAPGTDPFSPHYVRMSPLDVILSFDTKSFAIGPLAGLSAED